jgi:hypothetical protein
MQIEAAPGVHPAKARRIAAKYRQAAGADSEAVSLINKGSLVRTDGSTAYGLGEQLPQTPLTAAKHCWNVAAPQFLAPPRSKL